MSVASVSSAGHTVVFDEEERQLLLRIVEQAVRDKLVEVHRTDSLKYKDDVERQEAVMERILNKLRTS
jgi:hypothetical protein